ncbi:MAG: glyoxalase family protein [Chloroflexota bacterium]|jgi:glyoxalase family protein|nr:glyoxalase family protein [Chloroflexota bacterium]
MRLEGIHHISCITGDAAGNVAFYAGTLGLRLVKKTVNQDDPTVYHLFYADEKGSPGADLTFFEYPGGRPGQAGDGMVHLVAFRVASEAALDFWQTRLGDRDVATRRADGKLDFNDPEGLALRLNVVTTDDAPLVAAHPDIPAELALQGFDGVRTYSENPERSRDFLASAVAFSPTTDDGYESRGAHRGSFYAYDPAPGPGVAGAGTVHHVAWACQMDEQEAWRQRVIDAGGHPTPVIDRFYFRSVYFREPSGVLFEIATIGPGFASDEDPEHLGERLSLPPAFEHLRPEVEKILKPLPNPRQTATVS